MSDLTRPWRQKSVIVLLVVTFVSSAAVWAAVPYLPIFLTEVHSDIPISLLGVAVAASSVGLLAGQYPMARIAPRISIRHFILANLVLEGISLVGTLFAALNGGLAAIVIITVLRFIAGFARAGTSQATRAAVRKLSVVEQRAEVYGLVGAADIAGISAGTAIAGLIAFMGVDMVFIVSGIACLASAPLAFVLPKSPPVATVELTESSSNVSLRTLALPLSILLAFTVATTVLIGAYNSAWGPYLRDRGAGEAAVGLLFAAFTIPFIVIAPLYGRWATTSRRRVLGVVLGSVLAVAAAVAYPALTWLPLIIVIELIAASGSAAAEPSLDALVSDITDDEDAQSRIFGIAGTAASAVSAGSSVLTGVLMPIDIGLPFLVAGLAAAAALAGGSALLATARNALASSESAGSPP